MEITLENVGRIYTWNWAVRNVSASVRGGESICILGENGSGKSTLLKMLAGVLRPTEGTIRINDRNVRRGAIGVSRKLLLLHPDQPMLGNDAVSHLGAAISLFQCDQPGIEQTASDWLQRLKVPSITSPQEKAKLSRGQTMKLWMATLFTLRPPIWLLDEPHQSGLDPFGMETLENEIGTHLNSGGIVVFTSQWPPHARRLAKRMWLLHNNRLVFDGGVNALSGGVDCGDRSLNAILRQLDSDREPMSW